MKMEMERKNIQKENRCVEVAEEYANHNKHPNVIKEFISEIIWIMLIM